MRTHHRSARLLSALVPLLAAAPASAGELRRDAIPADVRWLVHVDTDAFAASELFRALAARRAASEEGARSGLGGLDEVDGLFEELEPDVWTDLDSATVFGSAAPPERAVVQVELSPSGGELLERATGHESHLEVIEEDLRLHAWRDDDGEIRVLAFAFEPDDGGRRLVLLSESLDELARCVRVARGDGESLADLGADEGFARPEPGDLAFLESRAGVPGLERIDRASSVARLARALRLRIAEHGGELDVRLRVATDDAEDCRRVGQVLQGIVALAALAAPEDEELAPWAELAASLSFEPDGRELHVRFSHGSEELVRLLERTGWSPGGRSGG